MYAACSWSLNIIYIMRNVAPFIIAIIILHPLFRCILFALYSPATIRLVILFFIFFFFISQNTLYKWEQKEECSKCNYALDIIGTTQNGCDGKMQWRCSSIPEVHLRGIMRFVGDKRKKKINVFNLFVRSLFVERVSAVASGCVSCQASFL